MSNASNQDSLKNPPIVEALAQINFESRANIGEFLNSFVSTANPQKKDDILQIDLRPEGPQTNKIGHRLSFNSNKEVVQIGPDFVSDSYLEKYDGWDVFAATFMKRFETAIAVGKIVNINKFALRYVNKLSLPMQAPISEYLSIHPEFKDQSYVSPRRITASYESAIMSGNGVCILNQQIESRPTEGKWFVVLDLEVLLFRNEKAEPKGILSVFNQLRLEKNKLFKATLTKKAYERFNE